MSYGRSGNARRSVGTVWSKGARETKGCMSVQVGSVSRRRGDNDSSSERKERASIGCVEEQFAPSGFLYGPLAGIEDVDLKGSFFAALGFAAHLNAVYFFLM